MRFPLADWIDDHPDCRHNLATSGMRGTIRHPTPSASELRSATDVELRRRLGDLLGVHASRVFLTHGATEADAWALTFLARHRGARAIRCRVRFPEYPPLFDAARWAGCRLLTRSGPTELAIISQPRNPVGDLWPADELEEWMRDTRATIVDETFREFSPAASIQRRRLQGVWSTGSFTKAYGADDLRVGFVVPPEEEQERFSRFHGVVADELSGYSVAGALATLAERDRILGEVRALVGRNQALWRRTTPQGPRLAGPVAFDDPVTPDGDRFAHRCLRASVLVCPGALFGRGSGVRVGLTRRSFPRDLAAYLRVRDGAATRGARGSSRRRKIRRIDRSVG